MGKSLVIVESPAKSRTLNQFLGSHYTVRPSMGHIIDLPASKMGVDVEKGFEPTYVVIKGKKKLLDDLKKEAKSMEAIYLAPDPDREGEAISWHLKNALSNHKKIYRVVFHEITKEAVLEAFRHPGDVDLHLVNAQQARRILDRIVGYSLSPLLWKKVRRGLSAGRVQSVTVRLVVDREKEIQAFLPKEYWELEAELSSKRASEKGFVAKLEKIGDGKAELSNETDAKKIQAECEKTPFVVQDIRKSEKKKSPSPPFITSKLQQDAFNKFHFSAARTMKIAQELYEGLDIGPEGTVGLITYMRTDSVRVSETALHQVRDYIGKTYDARALPKSPNVYRSKKSAQEAHEAIRPTSVFRTPESLKAYLDSDQLKLYRLIWARFVASQMEKASFQIVSVDIACGNTLFRASSQLCLFPGFLSVYASEEDEAEKEKALPELSVGETLTLHGLTPSQHFTKPPARYTEGSLVKALEELGIGRPSTYAPTLQTVVQRGYVHREKGSLVPTELGTLVTRLLIEHFPKILDIQFTAMMEEQLDEIEEGKMDWISVLKEFYRPFAQTLSTAKVEMKKEVVETDERCEKCGRPMVIKWGKAGQFLSCSGFPTCKNAKPIASERTGQEPVKTDERCEKCGRPMAVKWGRGGQFLGCSGYPECKNAKPISTGIPCPQPGCDGHLVKRRARKGGRFFYGCSRYPKCTFIANQLPAKGEEVA